MICLKSVLVNQFIFCNSLALKVLNFVNLIAIKNIHLFKFTLTNSLLTIMSKLNKISNVSYIIQDYISQHTAFIQLKSLFSTSLESFTLAQKFCCFLI